MFETCTRRENVRRVHEVRMEMVYWGTGYEEEGLMLSEEQFVRPSKDFPAAQAQARWLQVYQ